MSNFQEWCVKVLPFVQAAANGEVIEVSCDNGISWDGLDGCPLSDPALQFDFDDYDYRIKPRTIMIGDIEVPEPMRVAPEKNAKYYITHIVYRDGFDDGLWAGRDWENELLSCGLIHLEKEAAITHAKALIALTAKKDASHE